MRLRFRNKLTFPLKNPRKIVQKETVCVGMKMKRADREEDVVETQTGLKEKCPQKEEKMLKEALGSLLRRRYNIYSVSPGMLRSVYCPPIPQC